MKDFDAQKRFWMVVNLSGRGAPTVRHESYSDAETEALRLASRSNEREAFAVVESTAVFQRREPIVDKYVICGVDGFTRVNHL